MKKPSKPHHI